MGAAKGENQEMIKLKDIRKKKKDDKVTMNAKVDPKEKDQEASSDVEESVNEAEMTAAQKKKREEIVLKMKDKEDEFKKNYGDRWKEVMYATATKMAMKEEVELDEDLAADIRREKEKQARNKARTATANTEIDRNKATDKLHKMGLKRSMDRAKHYDDRMKLSGLKKEEVIHEENVKSSDRKPQVYTKPDGKKGVRMVPVDREIVKSEAKRVVHSVNEEIVKPSNTANPRAHKKAAVYHIGQANNHKNALKDPGMETSYYNDHKAAHKAHMDAADSHMAAHKVHKAGDSGDNRIINRTILANKKSGAAETATKTANESVIYEESDKSTDRLKMLVRLGLMDKKDMAKIIRSIGKMKEDKPVSPADRKILFDLLNELIGMVTGDEQMFQKAKKAVREEKDPNEYDKEGEMMKNQLRQICSANEKLMKMVGDDDNLPEWVQNKVTKATDYIRSVRDYLEAVAEGLDLDEISRSMTPMRNRFGPSVDSKKFGVYKKHMKTHKLDEPTVRMIHQNPNDAESKRMMKNPKYAQAVSLYKNSMKESVELSENPMEEKPMMINRPFSTDKVSRGTHFKALRGKK
jgi:hypothetical protein